MKTLLSVILGLASYTSVALASAPQSPQQSEIRILVYKGGYLSALGHNHVIYTREARGHVEVNADRLSQTQIRLSFPVTSLVVDDPLIRQEEGADFPGEVSASDIEMTRHNMLTKVFNAKDYPDIHIASNRISGEPSALWLDLDVTINGQTRQILAPVKLNIDDQTLTASGQFVLKQTDFEIEPLSILLGAIEVKNELVVKYRFTTLLAED